MWSRTHTDTDGVFWTAKSIRKATLVTLIVIMAILKDAPAAGDASLQPVCAAPCAQPCPTTPSYGCLRQLAQPSAPSSTRAATAREQGLRICTLKGPTPSSRCQGHHLCTSRQDSPEAGGSTGVSAPVPCCRSPAQINTLRCSSPSDMQRHLCFPDTSSTFHEWQKQSSHNPETVPRVIRRSGLSSGICHKHHSSAGPRNHAQQPANREQVFGESVKVSNRSWGCSWC